MQLIRIVTFPSIKLLYEPTPTTPILVVFYTLLSPLELISSSILTSWNKKTRSLHSDKAKQ